MMLDALLPQPVMRFERLRAHASKIGTAVKGYAPLPPGCAERAALCSRNWSWGA